MEGKKVECQYFTNDYHCASVLQNDEARLARKANCENDDETACCYLCSRQKTCEISCNYLGAIQSEAEQNADSEGEKKGNEGQVLRCSLCGLKMRPARTKIRIGGWEGATKMVVRYGISKELSELGEAGEELLPVVVHLCPKCGKMEFVAEEKTKQKLLYLFGLSLM